MLTVIALIEGDISYTKILLKSSIWNWNEIRALWADASQASRLLINSICECIAYFI
jgi:hypothetical protein